MQITIPDSRFIKDLETFRSNIIKILSSKAVLIAIICFFFISAIRFYLFVHLNNIYNEFKAMRNIFIFCCVVMQLRFFCLYSSQISWHATSELHSAEIIILLMYFSIELWIGLNYHYKPIQKMISEMYDLGILAAVVNLDMATVLFVTTVNNYTDPFIGTTISHCILQYLFVIFVLSLITTELKKYDPKQVGIEDVNEMFQKIDSLNLKSVRKLSSLKIYIDSLGNPAIYAECLNDFNELSWNLRNRSEHNRLLVQEIENLSFISRIKRFFAGGDTISTVYNDLEKTERQLAEFLLKIEEKEKKIISEQKNSNNEEQADN